MSKAKKLWLRILSADCVLEWYFSSSYETENFESEQNISNFVAHQVFKLKTLEGYFAINYALKFNSTSCGNNTTSLITGGGQNSSGQSRRLSSTGLPCTTLGWGLHGTVSKASGLGPNSSVLLMNRLQMWPCAHHCLPSPAYFHPPYIPMLYNIQGTRLWLAEVPPWTAGSHTNYEIPQIWPPEHGLMQGSLCYQGCRHPQSREFLLATVNFTWRRPSWPLLWKTLSLQTKKPFLFAEPGHRTHTIVPEARGSCAGESQPEVFQWWEGKGFAGQLGSAACHC